MARFSKNNFKLIMKEIKKMQAANENIDVPIGILEIMFDDYWGRIDYYFHSDNNEDEIDALYDSLIELTPHCI